MKKIIIARSILHSIGGQDVFFSRGNLKVYTARTSEEVLNIHGVQRADVIITESTLPLMGGVKLCAAIRGDADLKDVSIILVCDGTEAEHCGEAHANAVLPKPLDPVQLFSKVSELLLVPRRQHIRSLLHVSVNGREGNSSFLGVSSNISISGLLLETDRPLKKGDAATCAVTIGRREIVAQCVVMRAEKASSGKYRYGVKFVNLDMKALVLIEQFVKGRVQH